MREQESRERRLQALHQLAAHSVPGERVQQTPILPSRQHIQRAKLVIIAGMLLAVALVVVLVREILPISHAGPTASRPLVLDPAMHQLVCIKDAAWSPDGKSLAVLGYQIQCASDNPTSYSYEPGLLVIYTESRHRIVVCRVVKPSACCGCGESFYNDRV